MKNTTAYLGKIHWAFLLALLYSLSLLYLPHISYDTLGIKNDFVRNITVSVVLNAIIFSSLGLVTSKWKEALIALGASVILTIAYLAKLPDSLTSIRRYTYFFIFPVPVFLFIVLQSRWQVKSILVYFGVLVASTILILNFYTPRSIEILMGLFKSRHEYLTGFLKIIMIAGSMVFFIITICELLKYMQGDRLPRTLLINLGNDYDKRNSLLAFWSIKTALITIGIGASNFIENFNKTSLYMLFEKQDGLRIHYMIVGTFTLISIVLLSLFLGWYMRKALLEYFITYNIRSKFLYWLALVPVIGFLSFLIMESPGKQSKYTEKVDSMGNFASSSSAAITIMAFIFLFIRMVIRLSNTATGTYLSVVLASLLFTWMIYNKAGYYMNAIVIILCLLTIIVFSLLGRSLFDELAIAFSFLVIGLAQLIMLFPVYHFEQFVYIPSENPDSDTSGTSELFA